jgi:hypothetical protein
MPTKSHPGQQLTLSVLPRMLVQICHDLVEKHHQTFGYSSIVKHLWHLETNGFIAIHKDLFVFLYNATMFWKVRNLCVLATLILITIAVCVNGWIALGLIPVFFVMRHLTKRMYSYYTLISGLMLAFEMAASDYGGWVTGLSNVQSTASDRLQKYLPESPTRFLDFYLPNRNNLPESDQAGFAAIIKADFEATQPEHMRQVEAIFGQCGWCEFSLEIR